MHNRLKVSAGIIALSILAIPINGKPQTSKNLSLLAAIEIAQQNNPQLIALEKQVAAEKGRAWTTWWPADPTLAVEWEGVPRGSGLDQFEERRVTLSQVIEFPTNLVWRNRLASREIRAAEMRYAQGQAEIRAKAITAFSQFWAGREGLSLAQERVRLAQEFVDKAEIRRQVGEAPAIETVRARVELARAQNELRNAENTHVSAKAHLNSVLGYQAGQDISSADSLAYLHFELSLSEIKQQALIKHPLVGEANARVGAASHLKKLAWGNLLPVFEISGFRQNIDGNPNFYGVEIGLKLPLWFAFRQRGEIQQASALLAAQQNRRTQTQLQLIADIESAYAGFEATKSQVNMFEATLLDQAQEVYRIALRSYEEGEIGYLQLLEAQQTMVEVRGSYIETLANYYAAIAGLEKAGGINIFNLTEK